MTIFVENGGQVLSNTPDSFHSKAYAILSVLVFCCLLATIYTLTIQNIPTMLSDSESFLDHLQASLSTFCCPQYYLSAAINIELQIMKELEWQENPLNWEHVHSHADRIKPKQKLTWKELLNQQADNLATLHLKNQPSPSLVIPLPAVKIHLNFRQITITHHFASQMHFLATEIEHWKYMKYIPKFDNININKRD